MNRSLAVLLSVIASATLTGCYISKHKDGKNENVNIATPFGSMQVKTDTVEIAHNLGIAIYPGSVAVSNDHDKDSAKVNMNFGDFHLGVVAASYQTPDAPSRVESFYRKDLSRYGAVIKCQGDTTVGQPARTEQGLTCKDNDKGHSNGTIHISESDSNAGVELRAGSAQHQHTVSLDPRDGGTRIGLVALDLPGTISLHDDKPRQEQ